VPPLRRGIAILGLLLPLGGCFDSDEKGQDEPAGTTEVYTTGPPVTTGPSETGESSTGPPPDVTCRDAIECIVECAAELQQAEPDAEPDLSCFLDCEAGLNVDEALALLRLGACISEQCFEQGACDGPTGTTGTGTGSTGGPNENACLNCIAANAMDPQPPGCLDEALVCE
jgi:hypothetical protein